MTGGIGVRIDMTACTGHGLCAVLLGERVRLDEWGYPIVDPRPVGDELIAAARDAAAHCPTRALRLRRVEALPIAIQEPASRPVSRGT